MIGQTLSRYRLTRRLGAGGMGEVYLAEDLELRRRVAIKVLPPDLAADSDLLARLEREARALAALDHPNVVSVYSLEEAEGIRFLTMAFVEGQTLDELLPDEGFPVEQALGLAGAMADALRAAHERGIVHRDLKPTNIMVDREGRLRVLDFGIAKQLPSATETALTRSPTKTMTEAGAVIGTFPYMSPEQAEGRSVDARSDLFSFGVVLFEMLVGVRPFQGRTPTALISSILKDDPPPLNHLKPSIPASLARVVERCLEKEPDDRYATAAELREALVEVTPTGSRSVGRRVMIATALAMLVALGGWGVLREPVSWPWSPTTQVETPTFSSVAVLPLRNGSGDPEQDYFVDGMTEALITDLSKIGALKVISRSAAMRYRDTDKTLAEIGAELGVEALVEGRVLREGDRVGITVQLIETATERNLWAERYSRELESVLALQADLARSIARQVEVTLSPKEEALLGSAPQVDAAAYEAYLKGMHHFNKLTPVDLETALRYFHAALDEDPDYAPAIAGVADVWLGRQQMGIAPPQVAMTEAKAAATRAVEVDDQLAASHRTLAILAAWGEWDWDRALREYERALEIQPNDPRALAFYSHVLALVGEKEAAAAAAERALELDPFDPFYKTLAAGVRFFDHRYEDAIVLLREALDAVPNHPTALETLWACLDATGQYAEAAEIAQARFEATGEEAIANAIERGAASGGYREAMTRAAAVLDARPPEAFVPALLATWIYLGAGDVDGSVAWMERALEIGDPSLPYLAISPVPDELRMDPRYQAVIRAVGLEPGQPDAATDA